MLKICNDRNPTYNYYMEQANLTESDIIRAANTIAAQGTMPTIAAVRELLGGRGSETTIFNYLSKWKRNLLKYAALADQESANLAPIAVLQAHNQALQANFSTLLAELEKISGLEQAMLHEVTLENVSLKSKIEVIKQELKDLLISFNTIPNE